ncbi:hypothetical protein CDD80_6929 [Ophiocordyceps camponoti-rufipedis]|uniref:Uncharacterized protein n=1 Tax=Ophiocordyceps camponoti-rufipedis TaxID=2004952 RepID=A0A2C5ZG65_9HYPO|nr:hypothetical protein CDD80_6929 [Ophiocordyceps camponoti-rufipedis]
MKFSLPLCLAALASTVFSVEFELTDMEKIKGGYEAIARRIPAWVEAVERVSPDLTFLGAHTASLEEAINDTIAYVKDARPLTMRETQIIFRAMDDVQDEGRKVAKKIVKMRDRVSELKLCGFVRGRIHFLQHWLRYCIARTVEKFPEQAKGVGGMIQRTTNMMMDDWQATYTLKNCYQKKWEIAG